MASVFISHSSKDDALASDLELWLKANGFVDLFIDHRDIRVGDKWAEELRKNAGACRVVISLITESWLASPECFTEFRTAWLMGKRNVPLFLLPNAMTEMTRETLDARVWGRSDSVHFNRANAALDDALRSDPAFAAQMDDLTPGVQSSVSKVGGRATPDGWVWHHDVEPGTMQLVPTNQLWDPKFWNTFHPDGRGGYAIWARPAGAPPRK